MNSSDIPNPKQPKKSRLPHWAAPILLFVMFLVVHVAIPYGLSLLSTRYGWYDGRPGAWNLLALLLVAGGIAGTLWMISLHYQASPRAFLEFEETQTVLTRGPYAYSRNPMFFFELVFWFGWVLFYGSIAVLIGFLFLFAAFNFAAVPWEERHLEARFGEAYRSYKALVPRWFGLPRKDQKDKR